MKRGCWCLFSALAFSIGCLSFASAAGEKTEFSDLSDEQLNAEMEAARRSAQALRESPDAPAGWRKMIEVEKKLTEAYQDQSRNEMDRIFPLRRELQELRGEKEAMAWREKVEAADRRQYAIQGESYERRIRKGAELYRARHAELLKGAPAATPRARALGFDVLTFPRVDGSTSTQPLAVLVACRCLGTPYEWVGKRQLSRAERTYGSYWDSGDDYRNVMGWKPEPEFDVTEFTLSACPAQAGDERRAMITNRLLVTNSSTHQGYVNVIEGRSDLGLLARQPSPDEVRLAEAQKVELDVRPLALDAFVVIVNKRNEVPTLSTEQIRGIYSGKVKMWKEVGGKDEPITPYQRDENSGSQELMRTLVMKDLSFMSAERGRFMRDLIARGMGGPFRLLNHDERGLAYSVYYYERFMAGSAETRTIAVDGVEPTYDTIRERKYPYTSEVLVVTRKGLAADAPAARLRDWLLSEEGQAVIRESGYVPISAAVPPATPKR